MITLYQIRIHWKQSNVFVGWNFFKEILICFEHTTKKSERDLQNKKQVKLYTYQIAIMIDVFKIFSNFFLFLFSFLLFSKEVLDIFSIKDLFHLRFILFYMINRTYRERKKCTDNYRKFHGGYDQCWKIWFISNIKSGFFTGNSKQSPLRAEWYHLQLIRRFRWFVFLGIVQDKRDYYAHLRKREKKNEEKLKHLQFICIVNVSSNTYNLWLPLVTYCMVDHLLYTLYTNWCCCSRSYSVVLLLFFVHLNR